MIIIIKIIELPVDHVAYAVCRLNTTLLLYHLCNTHNMGEAYTSVVFIHIFYNNLSKCIVKCGQETGVVVHFAFGTQVLFALM